MPAVVLRYATTGPAVVLTICALSAAPVALRPPAPTEVPSASHAPRPPLAAGSKRRARMSLDAPLNSVQATIGLPLPSSVMLGRREELLVLLMPPSPALPASCDQPLPAVYLAT